MKGLILISLCFLKCLTTFGQDEKEADAILTEGKKLYRSEMASWYGSDIFREKNSNHQEKTGGYFSYTEKDLSKCIFFSRGEKPKVIATISFDSTYNIKTASYDNTERDFTSYETDVFEIRENALIAIKSDTLFKVYNNTDLNLIPLIENGLKKVYVLTGPQKSGVVIFGNDYLLTFGSKNHVTSKKKLHSNIIISNYKETGKDGKPQYAGYHSHLPATGDFITPTDICTLLLYQKFTTWEQYVVVSGTYFSIWDCKTSQLNIMTKAAWMKINAKKEKSSK